MCIRQLERSELHRSLWRRQLSLTLMGKLGWKNCWPSDMHGSERAGSSVWGLRQDKPVFAKQIGKKVQHWDVPRDHNTMKYSSYFPGACTCKVVSKRTVWTLYNVGSSVAFCSLKRKKESYTLLSFKIQLNTTS